MEGERLTPIAVVHVDADVISSRQLREPILLSPSKTLASRVRSKGRDISAFAEELEVEDTVSKLVEDVAPQHRRDHLYIIVQCQGELAQ